MLIKALCEYADKQSASPDAKTVPDGFSEQDIHYRIILSPEGDLLEIIDVREIEITVDKKGKEKKKALPRKAVLPERTQKPGIDSNYIEHRPLYIFGLNYENDVFNPDDKTNKAKKSHEAFVKHELEFMEGLDSEICAAYRKFIEKWVPENETENPVLMNLGKNYKGSYFGFSLGIGRENLESDEKLREKYFEERKRKNPESETDSDTVCGILGEKLSIARLHDKIKFPGGNTSGCVLVGMNDTAFESYGKTQSFNSNVSDEAMKKYTSAFNKLLSDKNHHTLIGDMVIVYFAMKENDESECGIFSGFFSDSGIDSGTEQVLNKFMEYAKSGYTTDRDSIEALEADPDVTFYVAGFTPNSSRICQKFMYRDKFGNIMKNLMKHQYDLRINESNKRPVYFWGISRELVSPKSSNEKVSPPLMTSIMLSAFNNTKYPDGLLSAVVKRVKTDSDDDKNKYVKLNDTRAGIIKACLNRKYKREEITMAWNEENKNPAYLCGGLFAVYEKIQDISSGGNLNRTIKDAYFASACSHPATVMPKLAKLSQNHMRKISNAEIANKLNMYATTLTDGLVAQYPTMLSLDDQGRFIIGYYQMSRKLYYIGKNDRKDD